MSNNSDYKKPFTNTYDLLPETLKTDVNHAFLENVVNRYLTKSELKATYGSIGKKSTRVKTDTRIPEPSVHRQSYQLQPLVHTKIASIDHLASYYDILTKASRLGIDKDRLPVWGNAEQFNFAPPVDYDKLVNWDRYYWYDPSDPNPTPQYITIKNMCIVQESRVNAKRNHHNELIASGTATPAEIAESQTELSLLETLRDCTCFQGSVGWDKTQWDDNPENWVSLINPAPVQPHSPSGLGDLWYDTVNGILKHDAGSSWEKYEPSTLSLGIFPWDAISEGSCISQTDDWSQQNKWYHQNDVPNITLAKRAEMPILEYNPFLELNQWSYTKHTWAYRGSYLDKWTKVNDEPSLYEMGVLFDVMDIELPVSATHPGYIVIKGKHTEILRLGTQLELMIGSLTSTFSVFVNSTYQITYDSLNDKTKMYVTEDTSTVLPYTAGTGTAKIVITNTSLGDVWDEFHRHWALIETAIPVPINSQVRPQTIAKRTYAPTSNNNTTTFVLNVSSKFLVSQDVIRVYVNGRRQYGTYQEGWSTNPSGKFTTAGGNFTSVDDVTYVDGSIPARDYGTLKGVYGNAIQFFDPLPLSSVVVIETGPAALSDKYLKEVEVRTSTDDDYYTSYFETNLTTLTKYRLVEQLKTQTIQYPLFDIFNVDGTTTYEANSIFVFEEVSTASVDPRIGKRIKITSQGKEFHFEQLLLKEDDGELFCYKDRWSITSSNPTGLQTIWRSNTPSTMYVPRYVNEYQLADGDEYVDSNNTVQTAHVPYGEGDWEIPNQLYYNVHHENRKKLKFSELVTHFRTIIEQQEPPVGFEYLLGDYYHLMDKPNYGIGGTIREYNNSYDTFLSAMFQSSSTPRSIIDFAQNQYEYNLTLLKEFTIRNAVSALTSIDDQTIWDPYKAVADAVITQFEQNDALDFAFGDSTTYNSETGKGIKNWIVTLPYLKLAFPVVPMYLKDDTLGIKRILHHDGHISDINVPSAVVESINTQLLSQTGGTTGATPPDYTSVTKGMYWKSTANFNSFEAGKLYRFNVVSTGYSSPSVSHPLGTYWLDRSSGLLYIRTNSVISGWKEVNGNIGDIEEAWENVDIVDLIATVILEAETRLYENVPAFDQLVFDFDSLISTPEDQVTFVQYLKEQYFDYLKETDADPFITIYDSTDPFTWNYSDITLFSQVKPGFATAWDAWWETIYENNFGTAYPHLMPWRLQGYLNKPDWWDTEYMWEEGKFPGETIERRWSSTMWNNIKQGRVPVGKDLPNPYSIGSLVHTVGQNTPGETRDVNGNVIKYNFVCVNTTLSPITVGSRIIKTDDLLPPYVAGSNKTFLQTYFTQVTPFAATLDDTFVFGEQGPVEHEWRTSSHFLYDLLHIAFRMQPVRFFHHVFGSTFVDVAGLQIDVKTNKVFSHKDTTFHGDMDDNEEIFHVNGFNQWYINYIRFNNLDINTSDFKKKWTEWDAKLSYQTGSFINTKSLDVSTKYFPIIERDYQVLVKKTPDMEDYWVNALLVTTQSVGNDWTVSGNSKVPRYNGDSWIFRVDTPSPIGNGITYYGVKKYSCTFDENTDKGTLVVGEIGLPWAVVQGTPLPGEEVVYVRDDTLTWVTGTPVQISSTNTFPAPLSSNTTYYIIKVNDSVFKLAESYNEAVAGLAIDITSSTTSTLFVEEVVGMFVATNGSVTPKVWKHLGIDKRVVTTDLMPSTYMGIETLINLIDGYKAYLIDIGWIFNDPEAIEVDVQTGKILSWQTETERLINSIYSGLGVATIQYNSLNQTNTTKTYHEVNPFRNNIWFNTERGTITNIYTGPYTDIRVDSTLYDQVGQSLPNNSVFIFRSDKKSRIRSCSLSGCVYAQSGSVNSETDGVSRAYESPHLAGAHIFLDGYEHIIMFNKRTTEDYLIYDPFIGLSTNKFTLVFEKGTDYTFRPNIGGYYLNNTQTVQNIENSVENMQYYYDTYRVNETADYLDYARAVLGYEQPTYLDHINISPKSKFIFWRGMIQNKGSVGSIKAFINARLFVDAKVDEFWAYKIGEYGNVGKKIFNDLNIQPNDVLKNELRLQFVTGSTVADTTFKGITHDDKSRWEYYPDQRSLIDPDTNFFFDAEVIEKQTGTYENVEVLINTTIGDGVIVTLFDTSSRVTTPLIENIHYTRINNTTLKIHAGLNDPYGSTTNDVYFVYILSVAKDKHNPAKLIDKKTLSVISSIMIWHPALGMHYHVPVKEIDTWLDKDPANYNNTISETVSEYKPRTNWNSQEVGTVWLKTNTFGYVPYYDTTVFPNILNRIYYWGRETDWSTFDVYQWTESPVPPSEWVVYVEEQSTNTEVEQHLKPSGVPMNVLYKHVNVSTVPGEIEYSDYVKIDVNPRQTFTFTTTPSVVSGSLFPVNFRTSYNVLSTTLVEPPLTVNEGDVYQLNDVGIGGWEGFDGSTTGILLEWNGVVWTDITWTTRKDLVITNGHPIRVYSNGLYRGDTTVKSVISEILVVAPSDALTDDVYIVKKPIGVDTIPPNNPNNGDAYEVGVGATGEWVGQDGKLAVWNGDLETWEFHVNEWAAFSSGDYVKWNGVSWVDLSVSDPGIYAAISVTGAYVDITNIVSLNQQDTLTIEYPVFGSDVDVISTETIEYVSFTPYTRVDKIDVTGTIAESKYYFWVSGKNIKPSTTELSLIEIQTLLRTPSVPYMFMQGFKPTDASIDAPARFTQTIVRGISKYVNEDERFKIRFLTNDSLRDAADIKNSLTKKNIHTQWELFRQEQSFVIAEYLWKKLEEAVVGYKLNDPSVPVPSMERVLFDEVNGTVTRIGLGEGQTFVDKELALNTIIREIENPNYDLFPVDKSFFLDNFSFDTPENILAAMDYIYNTFAHLDTNRIFFACLHDALSLRKEYNDVFKTSTIALHGIRLLETIDRVADD